MIQKNGKVLFTTDELKCKGSGMYKLLPGFADALADLRIAFDRPMNPISGCRSTLHNKASKGAKDSFHICDNDRGGSCAVDIATPSAAYRTDLVKLALSMNWSVGIKASMVHLDRRDLLGHPQVIFVY
jgi:hypothetical protein